MTILKMNNVNYSYNSSKEKVLKDLNIEFESGKFYAVIGKSGSGKSTFLSLLAGLDVPTKGSVLFDNEDIAKSGYSHHRSKHVSLVFQNYNLIDYLTPLENLKLVNKDASKDILMQLGLEGKQITRNVLKLSGGQQQRVAIARAIVNNPKVLIADEPTGNLDPEISWEIMQVLERINLQGTTIIMATHNSTIVNNLRHRVVAIEEGRIVRDEEEGEYGYHD